MDVDLISLEVEMEELLFQEMFTSPAEDHVQNMKDLDNINVKNASQRTLLHQAVMLGKPDWVREILEAGADPLIEDKYGRSALNIAQDMASDYPGDRTREEIQQLVQSRHNSSLQIIYKSTESVAGSMNKLKMFLFTEISASKSSIETKILEISGHLTNVKQSVEDVKKELADFKKKLGNTVSKVDTLQSLFTTEHSSIRESMETQMKEIVAKLENCRNIGLPILNPSPPIDETPKPLYKPNREACVEAMMRKTELKPSNEDKILKMKRWYEMLYDEDRITSCIMEFLRFQSSVKVSIDFESIYIGRIKPAFRDHDGIEKSGSDYYLFADFEEQKAYVSGDWRDERVSIAYLANSLSQLSVYLAFNNRGLPYSGEGDGGRFKRILEEAEKKKRDRVELHFWIRYYALIKQNLQGKEIYLTSAVPYLIFYLGSSDGRSLLSKQLPSLLEYYDQHVVATLSKETKKMFECARG